MASSQNTGMQKHPWRSSKKKKKLGFHGIFTEEEFAQASMAKRRRSEGFMPSTQQNTEKKKKETNKDELKKEEED